MTEPIARIEAALGRLGSEHEPPAGWEAKVLAAVAKSKPAPKRPWWLFTTPAFAMAAGVAIWFAIPSQQKQPPTFALEVAVGKSATAHRDTPQYRGTSAHLGQVVTATASGGGPHRAVWIYRKSVLVAACPSAPQCRITKDSTSMEFTLDLLGDYKVVALASSSPISSPTGSLDADLALVDDILEKKTAELTVN